MGTPTEDERLGLVGSTATRILNQGASVLGKGWPKRQGQWIHGSLEKARCSTAGI